MPTNEKKQCVKVTLGYNDGSATVVEPGSGHSIILSVTKDGNPEIEQIVAGKITELCSLFDNIIEKNPDILKIVTAARIARQETKWGRISDEAFRALPVGGNA